MRQRLRQTIFAAFLVFAAIWVVWIFYFFGELAYGVFSIPVLPNATLDFLFKNLVIFALLGSVDKFVDIVLGLKNRALTAVLGVSGVMLAYFLICFYFYIIVQVFVALFDYARRMFF